MSSENPGLRRVLPVALAAAVLLLLRWHQGVFGWSFEDLTVYRRAGAALLHGQSPYASTEVLPFTYPPFAAVLFVPFHLVGPVLAASVLSLLSVAGLVTIVRVSGRRFEPSHVLTLGVLSLALEPVLRTFRLGQINLILVALVLIDVLVLPPRWRGVLTGLAAGLKLTPGIFVIYFLLRRDWAAVARGAVTGLVTIGISAAANPHATWLFWTKLWYDPDHVGGVAYVDNQSVFGVLVRLTRSEHPARWLVLLVDLAALALAVVAARRQLAAEDELAALTCVGIAGLLVSPVSWSHHWIWLIPALFLLWRRRWYVTFAVLAGLGYLAPWWFTPAGGLREFHQAWWQELLCASLPLAGLMFLLRLSGGLEFAGRYRSGRGDLARPEVAGAQ